MKVIAFPFAGGNRYSFSMIKKVLPAAINFTVLEYPGRGLRMSESLMTNLDAIINDAYQSVKSEISKSTDYFIYGHSMGALVGYLICHKLEVGGEKLPVKLIVSGRRAPSVVKNKNLHLLDKKSFWNEIHEMGGVPNEILQDNQMLNFFEPILRADFQAISSFDYQKKSPLSIPIDVFYGDKEIEELNEIEKWKDESLAKVNTSSLPGGHFFIFNNVDFFGSFFQKELDFLRSPSR